MCPAGFLFLCVSAALVLSGMLLEIFFLLMFSHVMDVFKRQKLSLQSFHVKMNIRQILSDSKILFSEFIKVVFKQSRIWVGNL